MLFLPGVGGGGGKGEGVEILVVISFYSVLYNVQMYISQPEINTSLTDHSPLMQTLK